ncbi:MAG TPA: hypothetical protein VFL99_12590 [Segeticoccus sp.]|uniref:hypothetical protein n=1 Tax=Segeticoccus sp. TaxID=2706531 RepID=UPI002D8036F6|nr:hypothetical protein [Segeticoccus sp.]HET8601159.1 hypothetical protein [Segeticoccus sp.]
MGDTQPDLELRELERELCRLPDISAARIVADETGMPTEVHVLALPGKHPKQVVRDIQSVALASFGIEIDRRVVSVVQFGADGPPAGEPAAGAQAGRPTIEAITAETSGLRSLVRVTMRGAAGHDAERGGEVVGFAEGSIAAATRHRLVATATLDALRQLEPAAECLDVESAQVLRVGPNEVAVVTIVFVLTGGEQLVSGSALVRNHQDTDAVARAVLDATNRRLPQLA